MSDWTGRSRTGLAIGLGGPSGGEAPFDPAALFGAGDYGAWYDVQDLATMFQDSAGTIPAAIDQPVGRINDKSGNANHAAQSSAAARPMLRHDGVRYFLEFDGSNDYLQIASAGLYAAGSGTVVTALRGAAQTTRRYYAEGRSSDTTPIYALGSQIGNGAAMGAQMRDDAGVQKYLDPAGSPTPFTGGDAVLTFVDTGAVAKLRGGGVPVYSEAAYARTAATFDRAAIGCLLRTSPSSFFGGRIYQHLMIGRALGEAEIAAVEAHCAAAPPAGFDLFIVAGQSNAEGRGSSAASPHVVPGWGIYFNGSAARYLDDPVGDAGSGSAWPAFANAYGAAGGRAAVFVEAAISGSSLIEAASGGAGYWDPAGGASLYVAARDAAIAARDHVAANLGLGTVNVIWVQGERDAEVVNGTSVAGAIYQGLLKSLADAFDADLGIDRFIVSELGVRSDGANAAGWSEIRNAQNEAAAGHAKIAIGFAGAKDFSVANGKMISSADLYHYTQAGLDEMGAALGSFAAAL